MNWVLKALVMTAKSNRKQEYHIILWTVYWKPRSWQLNQTGSNPGVASSIPARSHTLVEIDHEIISTAILLPSADSFKKGCCQLQAKVCAQITG